MLRLIVLIWISWTAFGQDHYRVRIHPLDVQFGQAPFYLESLDQIETDGHQLYLRGVKNTEIYVISPSGTLLKQVGRAGQHPSEFGFSGVLAMAVEGPHLWAIDLEYQRVRLFTDGEYRRSFPLDSYNVYAQAATSNVFGFSPNQVVIPAAPKSRHLAAVYTYDGDLIQHVGEILPFSEEFASRVPGINDSFWLYRQGHWYSIHKYFPLVTRYDASFAVVDQFQVESEVVQQRLDYIVQFSSTHGYPAPIFTDAKFFGGDLFLMSDGYLHQLDLPSRRIRSITSFYGVGPGFQHLEHSKLTLFSFAFTREGGLFLGHPALLWDHDLWSAELPQLQLKRN